MRATLALINKYFWRGYIGPIFAYVIPVILTLFIGRIVGPQFMIPGAYLIPSLCVLLVFMPQTVFEFKNSSILKRIGSTPIKPYKFLLAIALFNFIIVTTAFIFLFLFSFLIFYDSLNGIVNVRTNDPTNGRIWLEPDYLYMIRNANWVDFIYSSIVTIVLGTLIGLFIASVSRSTLFIQSIGISLLLLVLFVGPVILPVSMVSSVDIVRFIGYIVPLKYPISLAIESFTSGMFDSVINVQGSGIWDVNSNYEVISVFNLLELGDTITVFTKADKIVNIIMPWVFIMIFSYLNAVTFGWSNRGKTVFNWAVIQKTIQQMREQRAYEKLQTSFNEDNHNVDSPYILEINHINKTFNVKKKGAIYANRDVTFKITRGKNLAMIGANGAGKTTLVEMIIGINKPDSGEFKYNFKYNHSFKEKIGVQFQDSSYPFGIRCRDVVEYFLKAYNIEMSRIELVEIVEKFGVSKFYNKNCASLSGGQQQRLNLLLSIIHKPKLLFLDELSTGLDIKIRNSIKTFIKNYAIENDITVVIISHDMEEVGYLCDDVVTMKNGEVVDITNVKDIITKDKSLESYIDKYL